MELMNDVKVNESITLNGKKYNASNIVSKETLENFDSSITSYKEKITELTSNTIVTLNDFLSGKSLKVGDLIYFPDNYIKTPNDYFGSLDKYYAVCLNRCNKTYDFMFVEDLITKTKYTGSNYVSINEYCNTIYYDIYNYYGSILSDKYFSVGDSLISGKFWIPSEYELFGKKFLSEQVDRMNHNHFQLFDNTNMIFKYFDTEKTYWLRDNDGTNIVCLDKKYLKKYSGTNNFYCKLCFTIKQS